MFDTIVKLKETKQEEVKKSWHRGTLEPFGPLRPKSFLDPKGFRLSGPIGQLVPGAPLGSWIPPDRP